MAEDNQREDQLSDVKASFAWGQLFAGSLIGGLAVWKLLHKMTNTEPSEWFVGLSVAYEEVRDFLMTPLEWIQLDLTATDRNLLTLSAVVAAAFFRSILQVPSERLYRIGIFLLVVGGAPVLAQTNTEAARALMKSVELGVNYWVALISSVFLAVGFYSVMNSLFLALIILAQFLYSLPTGTRTQRDVSEQSPMARFDALTFFGMLFTILVGTTLLLLNWATS